MTVHQLENSMPAEEFRDWITYASEEPFNVAEVQLATLLHMVASYMKVDCEPKDFMISHSVKGEDAEAEPLSGAAIESWAKGLV